MHQRPIRARLLLTAVLLIPAPALAQEATALPTVDVTSTAGADTGETRAPEQILRDAVRTSDTAAILRELPGVSAFDAGGVASLPTIRGLEADRIAILVDGIKIDDVCPNKMAPPLSFTDPQTIASITALTGVTPVSLGGDTIGGAISVETLGPRFAASGATLLAGRASAFYRSNGNGAGGALSLTAASDALSLTYNGSYTRSENYHGGGDGVVRASEFAKTDHALAFSALTGAGQLELRAGIQRAPREGFTNQYMDMTDNRSWFVNGRYKGVFGWGDLDLTVHYRDTDHEMNFLEDKGGIANGGMPMLTETHTAGYTLKLRFPVSARDTIGVGSEFHHQWLNDYWPPVAGSMMMGPNPYVNINGAKRDRLGSYLEWERHWNGPLSTVVGIRNDQLWMNTGDVQPYSTGMMSMADASAATAFNAADHARHDSNWSGSALARYSPSDRLVLEFGYAHKVRSPALYERYSWGRGSMSSRMIGWFGDGNGYVGNLDLAPERADTLSAALRLAGSGDRGWTLRVAPFFTHVADYIDVVKLRDLTDGMGKPTGFAQLQFANGEARFYGVDVSATLPLWDSKRAGSAAISFVGSLVEGDNLADRGALYHQMPVNAKVKLVHRLGGLQSHIAFALAADKTRVDVTRNEPETQGYALVDLGASYGWNGIRLSLDVENLLDTAYDLPLGGVSLGDYKATGLVRPVPGRGRSVNLGLSVEF